MVPLLGAKVLLEKGHLGERALRRVGFAEVEVLREGVLAAGEGALAEFPADEAETCEDQDSDYCVISIFGVLVRVWWVGRWTY